jgi:ATP-dependent Clp protease ATP-binding subunit ClpX
MIGFGSENQPAVDEQTEYSRVLEQVVPEDIIEFGMIPEFVGRVPVITTLKSLDEDALIDILTKPKNALVKQYKAFFKMEQADLDFTDDALKAIARKALTRDTGARALRALTEELMIDLMYRLPEEPKPGKYVITKDVVEGKADLFGEDESAKKESA